MQLKNLFDELSQIGGSTKTAAVETPKVSSAQEELTNALTAVLASAEKTAAAPAAQSAAGELEKMAAELAAIDQEALKKEAALFGTIFSDAAIARFAQYDAARSTKTASAPENTDMVAFEKWAAENPEAFNQAFAEGFSEGEQQKLAAENAEFEKWAATPEGQETIASYQAGYAATQDQITKLASTPEGQDKLASFQRGYADAAAQLSAIANSENGAEKIAAVQRGYAEGMAYVEKLAADTYQRGYDDTVVLLKNM